MIDVKQKEKKVLLSGFKLNIYSGSWSAEVMSGHLYHIVYLGGFLNWPPISLVSTISDW